MTAARQGNEGSRASDLGAAARQREQQAGSLAPSREPEPGRRLILAAG